MFYDKAFTVPANTARSSPVETVLQLSHGVMHYLEIGFPAGCAALAHLVLLHQDHQLYPTNPEGSFAADYHIIPIRDYFELFYEPFALKLRGWNLDDSYPHTITVRIGILPADVAAHIYGRRKKADRRKLYEAFGLPAPGG